MCVIEIEFTLIIRGYEMYEKLSLINELHARIHVAVV